MTEEKFSIIVTTNRGIEALESLFVVTDQNSELIISDSNYNDKTKEWLTKQKGYDQIVYVPVKKYRFGYTKDCILGMNTAFMYADNYWLFRGDDNLEFKDDTFEVAREDINYYSGMLDNNKFCVVGQKLWGSKSQQKWNDYSGLVDRMREITNPAATFSFGPLPIDLIYTLNGYDEIFDYGWGMEEEDFIIRAISIGYKFFYDKMLMGYSRAHNSNIQSIFLNKFLYEVMFAQVIGGKFRAFNAYDIRREQQSKLAEKDKYIIK